MFTMNPPISPLAALLPDFGLAGLIWLLLTVFQTYLGQNCCHWMFNNEYGAFSNNSVNMKSEAQTGSSQSGLNPQMSLKLNLCREEGLVVGTVMLCLFTDLQTHC